MKTTMTNLPMFIVYCAYTLSYCKLRVDDTEVHVAQPCVVVMVLILVFKCMGVSPLSRSHSALLHRFLVLRRSFSASLHCR